MVIMRGLENFTQSLEQIDHQDWGVYTLEEKN